MSKISKYKRTPQGDLSGPKYEYKMAAVLFLRGVNQTERFFLGTNVDGAGAFDDLVFKYKLIGESEFRICLIQLKHITGKITIGTKELIDLRSKFNICKYYMSTCELARNISNEKYCQYVLLDQCFTKFDFAIYTNTLIDNSLADQTMAAGAELTSRITLFSTGKNSQVHVMELNETTMKKIKTSLTKLVETKIKERKAKEKSKDTMMNEIINPVPEINESREKEKETEELKEYMNIYPVEEFLGGCLWFTNQATEKDLDNIIKDEIKIALETNEENVGEIAKTFVKMIELWWDETGESEVLTETAKFWESIVKSRLDLMNAAKKKKMKDSTIRYTNDGIDSFYQSLSDKSVVNVTSEIIHLTSLKVGQVLEKYHSRRFIFMEQSSMLPWGREIIRAWQSIWCDVLAIECSTDALSLADKLGRDSTGKKLILISKSALPGYEQHYDNFDSSQLEAMSFRRLHERAYTRIVYNQNGNQIAPPMNTERVRQVDHRGWLAQPSMGPIDKLRAPVPLVVISHTATYEGHTQAECMLLVRIAQSLHIESSGWSDIGYNFLVGGDGSVYVGRGWDQVGQHSHVIDPHCIGISFIGTFSQHHPPKQQWTALHLLIKEGVQFGKIRPDYRLIGHRQVSPTESPGSALFSDLTKHPHFYGGEVKSGEDVVRVINEMETDDS